jgi:hypothetical protein
MAEDTKKFEETNIEIDQTIVPEEIEAVFDDVVSTLAIQKTNKVWHNGKPIFRETIDFGALPNAGIKTKNLTTTSTEVDEITNIVGIWNNGTNYERNSFYQTTALFVHWWSTLGSPNTIKCQAGGNYTSYSGIAYIEYTKK